MTEKSKYSLYNYLLLLGTILMLFVFTKDFYFEYVETKAQSQTLQQTITQKNEEYDKLTKIKSEINSPKNKDLNLKKFLIKFSEDELLDYFYSYSNDNFAKVKIDSLNFSQGNLNEFGLTQGQIDLVATFTSEADMMEMIDVLLKSEKYNLYIHDFSYQFGSDFTGPIKVSIPLKVLYK